MYIVKNISIRFEAVRIIEINGLKGHFDIADCITHQLLAMKMGWA